ncbi:MAG: asparagine--tRNA ligase [Candidatus Hepatoplasma vulgare]|nr:MAG: asparagine--tRNA ligase [Candidatus Hepatoplasma sp.]
MNEIREVLINEKYLNKNVNVFGWIKYRRISKEIGFLTITDGSNIEGIQIVFKKNLLSKEKFEKLLNINLFTPVSIKGKLIKNLRNNLNEINLEDFTVLNNVDNDFILGKKEHSLEYLRENAHLRIKTTLFQAIMKIRTTLYSELISFFEKENFYYVAAPIITSNDAEGAGETFKILKNNDKPFFNNVGGVLSVSGQLHAESYAQSLGKVYTFAPTFRAENSNTTKHAAEFWMLEPEMTFYDYFKAMDFGEKMLKVVVRKTLEKCKNEFKVLESILKIKIISELELFLKEDFMKISYKEAIIILKNALEENKVNFDEKNIKFGLDFGTEHERYLTEKHFKKPVYIYDFPFKIKSFYMFKNNDTDNTVRGFDLLVSGIGELIGGSQREYRYETLLQSLKEKNINSKDLEWYLNLRKSGYAPSSGFGLGFERLMIFVTKMENIRDVIPFPRTPGKLLF